MAGLHKHTPLPTRIVVHRQSRFVEIAFDDGKEFRLPFELMRVYSPSAEVRGHGPGQETLQPGKRNVEIVALEPVGHYAVQPAFSDGHSTGIFSWDYLHWLGSHQDQLWHEYLDRLAAAGASRDPEGAPATAPVGLPAAGAGTRGAGDAAPAAEPDDAPMQATALSRPRS